MLLLYNKKKGVPYIYTLFLSSASIKFCWYSFILISVRWFVVDSSQITNKSFRGIKWERELLFDCWRSSYWGVARASRGRFRVIANAVQPPPTPPDGALFRVVLGHFHKMHSMGTRSQVVINIWEVLHGWLEVLTCANIIISIYHITKVAGLCRVSEWLRVQSEWVSCSCRERSQKQLRRENPRRTHARIAYIYIWCARGAQCIIQYARRVCVDGWMDWWPILHASRHRCESLVDAPRSGARLSNLMISPKLKETCICVADMLSRLWSAWAPINKKPPCDS
jgi:hypothetical protein